jgi:hypothetical protein
MSKRNLTDNKYDERTAKVRRTEIYSTISINYNTTLLCKCMQYKIAART